MKQSFDTCLQPILLASGDDTQGKEFQVLRVGKFNHPRYGTIEITAADLQAFVRNFNSGVRKIEIPINYEHGESIAHGTKAAGTIRSLSIKNEGRELWAVPEWTPSAQQAIKDGEWKYSSAEILWSWKDPESGKTHERVLMGAALTNNPFIKGMQKIAAHEQPQDTETKMKLSELESLLLSEHGLNLAELRTRAALVPGLEKQVTELSEAKAKSDDLVKSLTTSNADLTQKLELSEKAANEVKFNALVERGMKEGKLTKAYAEGPFKKIFETMGLKFTEEALEGMAKTVPTEQRGSGGGGKEGSTKKFSNPAEELAALAQELAVKEKISFNEATDRVFADNPKLAQRYHDWEGEGAQSTEE